MRSHEREFRLEMLPADSRPRREEPVEIFERFLGEVKNLQERIHCAGPNDWHHLSTESKRLRVRIESALKKPPLVFHPESFSYKQIVSLINEINYLEQIIEPRIAA